MRRVGIAAAVLLALPLLTAARDPRGDDAACGQGTASATMPDLIAVDGTAQELGTAAVWRLTFAQPLVIPDPDAPPMRIAILVRDPRLPPTSVGDARGLNRIVQWDARSVDQPVVIRWVPEGSRTPFNPPVIDGATVEIRVPGRILLGESASGAEPVRRLRWSVLVSEGGRCDRLGGRPALRLVPPGSSSPHAPGPSTSGDRTDAPDPRRGILIVGAGAVLGLLGLWGLRRLGPG